MRKAILNPEEIINDYNNGIGIETIALKYHTGKLRVKEILKNSGIILRPVGGRRTEDIFILDSWREKKYIERAGYHFVAVSKDGLLKTTDYMNESGILTSYIKKTFGKTETLYGRRKYYRKTGNYWWEQWFDIKEEKNKDTKKCPYCNWETSDVDNKSGAFLHHILTVHGISRLEHIKQYPEDREFLALVNKTLDKEMELDENKFVVCGVCGRKMSRLDSRHLKKHGLTKLDYLCKYGGKTYSKEYYESLLKLAKHMNISIDGTNMFTSKPEKEIMEFVRSLGFKAYKNRKLLNGKELDIFIPEKNLAIEFNGCKHHTENFGKKNREYHLEKTLLCNGLGVKLLQIFEDEYFFKKDIVFNKIKHLLGVSETTQKISGRKCIINEIPSEIASIFMEQFHIQGSVDSSVYLGAFFKDNLVAVMQFKKEKKDGFWELTRFASDFNFICQGIGGKLFSYFIRQYSPLGIKSFADRRWTVNKDENFYTKIGFKLVDVLPPSYTYYNEKIDRYKRQHKFSMRKERLIKKYNFPNEMTEDEMTKLLGYDRIWDCGLFKYVWQKEREE